MVLRGRATARGTRVGVARVLSEHGGIDVNDLQPDDVLVCRTMSRPSFKLFGRIVALVTDTGGALSSAATLAREYGIPTVMATAKGTSLIRDGQRVVVDGDRGMVLVLG